MKIKQKTLWIIGIIIVVVLAITLLVLRSPEDSWIKDEKGMWVKHGNPAETPDDVKEQQEAIECANGLYNTSVYTNVLIENQCLGACGNYVVDLVNVPRTDEDNKAENQCGDYRTGKANHFIELNNKNGEIVRIV